MNGKTIASLSLKGLLAAGSAAGVAALLHDSTNVGATLSYFTTQSNLFCIALFSWLFIRRLAGKTADPAWLSRLKGGVTVWIVLTGLVFNFVLRPAILAGGDYDPNTPRDFLVHVFTPILAFLDYVLFDARGSFRIRDPLLWLLYPALYWIYCLAFVALGGTFEPYGGDADVPYFFMDVGRYGPWYALIVAGIVAAIGFGLLAIDTGGARRARRKSDDHEKSGVMP